MLETMSRLFSGLLDALRDPVWQGIAGVIALIGLLIALYPKIGSKVRGRSDTARVNAHGRAVTVSIPREHAEPSSATSAPPVNQWFDGDVYTNLPEAKKEATRQGLPLFMVIYDGQHPKRSRIYYSLTHFLDYQTVKDLVRENFVQALVDYHSTGVAELVPSDDPLENCRLVVMAPNGDVVRSEGVYANPDVALRQVREDVNRLRGDST